MQVAKIPLHIKNTKEQCSCLLGVHVFSVDILNARFYYILGRFGDNTQYDCIINSLFKIFH